MRELCNFQVLLRGGNYVFGPSDGFFTFSISDVVSSIQVVYGLYSCFVVVLTLLELIVDFGYSVLTILQVLIQASDLGVGSWWFYQ